MRLLAGSPPQTMVKLIAAAGVTRTAVTEQFNELLAAGYVERSLQKRSWGRPQHLYRATEYSLRTLFPNNQRLLAPLLLEAFHELADRELGSKDHGSGRAAAIGSLSQRLFPEARLDSVSRS